MTHPLRDFLNRCLDETERVARAACQASPWEPTAWHWHVVPPGNEVRRDYCDSLIVKWTWPNEAEHIALHDPAAALALVEAHRQLLAIHQPDGDAANPECQSCAYTFASKTGRGSEEWEDIELLYEDWPCPTVRALASAYRHAPGWQSDWGPT